MTGQQSAPTGAGASTTSTGAGAPWNVDCATSVGPGTDTVPPAGSELATRLWARARVHALASPGPIPEYGTPEWHRLPETDRRRYAALIIAAERSRQPRPVQARPQRVLRFAAPRRPQATPGWPPVAVPGHRGAYLTPRAHREAA